RRAPPPRPQWSRRLLRRVSPSWTHELTPRRATSPCTPTRIPLRHRTPRRARAMSSPTSTPKGAPVRMRARTPGSPRKRSGSRSTSRPITPSARRRSLRFVRQSWLPANAGAAGSRSRSRKGQGPNTPCSRARRSWPGNCHSSSCVRAVQVPEPTAWHCTGVGHLFFTDDEYAVVDAACGRLIPGATEARVVDYVDGLLGAFAVDPPRIWAGGPFSGRRGGDAGFRDFIPLSKLDELAWRTRIEGSRGIPEREFN